GGFLLDSTKQIRPNSDQNQRNRQKTVRPKTGKTFKSPSQIKQVQAAPKGGFFVKMDQGPPHDGHPKETKPQTLNIHRKQTQREQGKKTGKNKLLPSHRTR
ncbi:hypothetical protein, partial [Labrenzia sp. DG1229]|uniref:hypothetical protein n=1 Tax=Labrenzia sp. DG1229 TaxID=681847 RepID=UPI001AD8BB0E